MFVTIVAIRPSRPGLVVLRRLVLARPRGPQRRVCKPVPTAAGSTATGLASLKASAGEASSVHPGADTRPAGGAGGARRTGRPSPRPRLPQDVRTVPREAPRGVPD